MAKDPSVWMKSLRWHTYLGRPQDEGEYYLACEDIVETMEILKFSVRVAPPKRATRRSPKAAT